MVKKQIKSRERVKNHGEVFTAEREVKSMCDLVKDETERIDSRFLEPACGDGNFLVEILNRKLLVAKSKYSKSALDFERQSILAVSSLYGVDILHDNVLACRKRLFDIWNDYYKKVCKKECSDDARKATLFILSKNIVCGNALTLNVVNELGEETNHPIIFSEWSYITGSNMQRKDYTLAHLLQLNQQTTQQSLLDTDGILLKTYITHYRRIMENG